MSLLLCAFAGKLLLSVFLLTFSFPVQSSAAYDLVILNGRVIDPGSRTGAIRKARRAEFNGCADEDDFDAGTALGAASSLNEKQRPHPDWR